MDCREFLLFTVLSFDDLFFYKLKDLINKENLVSFVFLGKNEVTKSIYAEKLYDFFDKTDLRDNGFDKILKNYFEELDAVVSSKIPKERKKKVNGEKTTVSARSRKYYDRAISAKKEINFQNLVDFSRIMMCLYTEIIKNNYNVTDNFDYSVDCLDIDTIIKSLYEKHFQHTIGIKSGNKELSHAEKYTFVILIIMYFYIKNNEVAGEH